MKKKLNFPSVKFLAFYGFVFVEGNASPEEILKVNATAENREASACLSLNNAL